MQDAYNLAWKLALVRHEQAAPSLLDNYEAERVPIGQQVVKRIDESVAEYGSILAARGLLAEDPAQGATNLAALTDATPAASAQPCSKGALGVTERAALAGAVWLAQAACLKQGKRFISSRRGDASRVGPLAT